MNTLQEFMFHTEAISYILAFAFLLVFIVFWRVLNQEKGKRKVSVREAESRRFRTQPEEFAPRWHAQSLAGVGVTLAIAGALAFMAVGQGGNPFQVRIPTTPGTDVRASDLPADHLGRTVCKTCHANAIGPGFPVSLAHASFADNPAFCGTCHKAASGGTTVGPTTTPIPTHTTTVPPDTTVTPKTTETEVTTTPATTPATSTPAMTTTTPATTTAPVTTTAPATGPKPIPAAGHQGMTTCKMCHANGVGPKYPDSPDHSAYADTLAFCKACHKAP